MARYASIETAIWTAETAAWPAEAKLLYVYLITNDHADGIGGVYQLGDPVAAFETGMTPRRLARGWAVILSAGKVRRFGEWIWIVGRAKHACRGPKQLVALRRYLDRAPAALQEAFWQRYKASGKGASSQLTVRPKDSDSVSMGYQHLPILPTNNHHHDHVSDVNTNSHDKSVPHMAANESADNGGEEISGWGNGSWGKLLKAMDPTWRLYLQPRRQEIIEYEPATALAVMLDLKGARKKPRDADQLQAWAFWRLKHGKFSDGNYDRAKRMLKAGR